MKKKIVRSFLSITLVLSVSAQMIALPLAYADDTASTTETTAAVVTSDATATASSTQNSSTSATSLTTIPTASSSSSSSMQEATSVDTNVATSSILGASSSSVALIASPDQAEHVNDISTSSQSGFIAPVSASSTSESASSARGASASSSPTGSPGGSSSSLAATTSNPTILSGDAVALANIINFLNTSSINSNGGIIVSNFLSEAPTIDLRDVALFTGMCGPMPCAGQNGIQINLLNGAQINNDIILSAMTGQNSASGTENSTTSIQSGNAFAGLNLINLANTTFVDSNYLLVTLNAFKGIDGDIVFPSLAKFFKTVSGNSAVSAGSSFINDATVNNSVSTASESGGNTTSGADTSVITSGNASAFTNVFNQINNILPDTRVSILFRIAGTWNGQVYGAPDGVSQVRGPDGSIFFFGATSSPSTGTPNLIQSTSTADIDNNVSVSALSGENSIENASTSLIATGNAFASANIINIANQHVIGRNWILAIINIFGDFKGDISFGRPDLWIGDQVDAPSVIQDGTLLRYKLSVINNGDADAHDVILSEIPDLKHVSIATSSLPFTLENGALKWHLGLIPAGKAVEVTYTAQVGQVPQGFDIVNKSSVSEVPSDNNMADNSDSLTVRSSTFGGGGGGGGGSFGTLSSASVLDDSTTTFPTITRMSEHMNASPQAPMVSELLIIKNMTDKKVKDVVLHDRLRDSSGRIIHDEMWKLDTVVAHEQININYLLEFAPDAPDGIYTLSTELDAKGTIPITLANGSITFSSARPQILGVHSINPVHVVARTADTKPIAHAEVEIASSSPTRTPPKLSLTAAAATAIPDEHGPGTLADIGLLTLLAALGFGVLKLFGSKGYLSYLLRP